MERRNFIKNVAAITAASQIGLLSRQNGSFAATSNTGVKKKTITPRAITMWDFSWIERRWSGAGYEDWDKALDELVERGYDAVRIDAYPHLMAIDPDKEWTLLPVWDAHDWGSPGKVKVTIKPALIQFITKCKEKQIKVGLSTWYREDIDNTIMQINSPEKMADGWLKVLDIIAKENLSDIILYVDLCNEWSGLACLPCFKDKPLEYKYGWERQESIKWMRTAIGILKNKYPEMAYTFSLNELAPGLLKNNCPGFFDLAEIHLWMAYSTEFYKEIGITWESFNNSDYNKIAEKGESLYREKPDYWNNLLKGHIIRVVNEIKEHNLPLISTECWSLVFYKDYPLLNWGWIKELCEVGVKTAASTGQFLAIAISNFSGPQFVGMWRDVAYHQKLTSLIKSSSINPDLYNSKLAGRL